MTFTTLDYIGFFVIGVVLIILIFMLIMSMREIRECSRKIKECQEKIENMKKRALDACKEVLSTLDTFKYNYTDVLVDGDEKRICHSFSNEKYTIVLWHYGNTQNYASIHLNDEEHKNECVYTGDNSIAEGKDVTIAFLTKLIEENHN